MEGIKMPAMRINAISPSCLVLFFVFFLIFLLEANKRREERKSTWNPCYPNGYKYRSIRISFLV